MCVWCDEPGLKKSAQAPYQAGHSRQNSALQDARLRGENLVATTPAGQFHIFTPGAHSTPFGLVGRTSLGHVECLSATPAARRGLFEEAARPPGFHGSPRAPPTAYGKPRLAPKGPQRAPKIAQKRKKCSPGRLPAASGDPVSKKVSPGASPRPPHMLPVQ